MILTDICQISKEPIFYKTSDFFGLNSVYLKIEAMNIAGSIKLKTANFLIRSIEKTHKTERGKTKIIESSSGNLGISLSIICKTRGYHFTCVTDPNVNPTTEKIMRAYGAEVIKVNKKDKAGGYLGTRLETINEMIKHDPNLIWADQYTNIANTKAHYETTAKEIHNEFGYVDYLFVGTGTTGTLMGCLSYFKEHNLKTRTIAVDPKGSVTFGYTAQKRNIPGLGTSRKPSILDESLVDEIMIIDEAETVDMCRHMLENYGLLLGGSSGTVLAAVKQRTSAIRKDKVCIAICADLGERYLDTVYNNDWVKNRIEEKQCQVAT